MDNDAEMLTNGASFDLLKYIRLLWRWVWLIILATILVGGAAFTINHFAQPVYSAAVILLINQSPSGNTGSADYTSLMTSERLAGTYVQLLGTRKVIDLVISRLGLSMPSDALSKQVKANVVPNTQLIRVAVEDTDPERAALVANTLARAFQEVIEEQQLSRYANLTASITTQIQQLEGDIAAAELEIKAMPATLTTQDEARLSQLDAALVQYRASYSGLLSNLSQIRLAEAQTMSNVSVAQEAEIPDKPIRPRTLQNSLLAALVGAILSTSVVLLIDYLDDTIRTPEDLEKTAQVPLLGTIAKIAGNQPTQMVTTALEPRSPVAEAYRALRTNLQYSSVDKTLKRILVTSATPSEGKSTTAANLAIVFAQAGKKVIVLDADLRKPTQHRYFNLPNAIGITSALLEEPERIEQYIQATEIDNVRVLTSGPLPPNPAELIDSQRFEQMLQMIDKLTDVVIMDSPPILSVTDAALLAHRVDGTLVVVDAGRSKGAALVRALELARKAGGNLKGVVLNRFNPSRSGSYANYYYYRYSEDGKHGKRSKKQEIGTI